MRYYGAVDVLLRLNARVDLPASLQALASEILSAPTLSRPLDEIATAVRAAADGHRDHVAFSERVDPLSAVPELSMIPTRDEVRALADYHERAAMRILGRITRAGLHADQVRALEMGCGTGYTTLALGALGVKEAIGVDVAALAPGGTAERDAVAGYFAGRGNGRLHSRTRLEQGDAHALAFPDGAFDLVHNASAIEHVRTPARVFCEASRVLRSGGFALFDVDPWFGPQGGHSLCTLDFPWGHIRLTPDEFDTYIASYRPHERPAALDFYRNGFQTPRHTAAQIETLAVDAGFVIVDWSEARTSHREHAALLSADVLADCTAQTPTVTVRDLMTGGYIMLLRKR